MEKTVLDATGLRCPLPVLRARKAMKSIETGALLEVHATDPSSVKDFQSYCQSTGDELVNARQDGAVYIFEIRKRR